jgi:hypothetical protein
LSPDLLDEVADVCSLILFRLGDLSLHMFVENLWRTQTTFKIKDVRRYEHLALRQVGCLGGRSLVVCISPLFEGLRDLLLFGGSVDHEHVDFAGFLSF